MTQPNKERVFVAGVSIRGAIEPTPRPTHVLYADVLYRPYRGVQGLQRHSIHIQRSSLRFFDIHQSRRRTRTQLYNELATLMGQWGFVDLFWDGKTSIWDVGITACNNATWDNNMHRLAPHKKEDDDDYDVNDGEVRTIEMTYNYSKSANGVNARFRSFVNEVRKHGFALNHRGSIKSLMDLVNTDFFLCRMAHPRVLDDGRIFTNVTQLHSVRHMARVWDAHDEKHPNLWTRFRVAVTSLELPCDCQGDRCKFLVAGFKAAAEDDDGHLCPHYHTLIRSDKAGEAALATEVRRLLTPPMVTSSPIDLLSGDAPDSKAPADIVFLTSSNDKLLQYALQLVQGPNWRSVSQQQALYVDYAAVTNTFLNKSWSWWLHDEPSAGDLSTLIQVGTELAVDMSLYMSYVLGNASRTALATVLIDRLFEEVKIMSPLVRLYPPAATNATKRPLETPDTLALLPPVSHTDAPVKGGYQGGLVLPAHPGFFAHTRHVDFDSHYPSIMVDFPIFYTCFGKEVEERGRKAFAQRVRMLIAQKRMSKENGNSALSLACKLRCNILYGCFGRQGLAMSSLSMASQITGAGRELLHNVVQLTATYLPGAKVLMGHTDAVLLSNTSSVASQEEYDERLERLRYEINHKDHEIIYLDRKDSYQWSWVLNKTRHVSLVERKSALHMLIELNAAIAEEWIDAENRDRLAGVVKRVSPWAKFPGLINASMPAVANLMTLVGMLVIAIQWTYEHEDPATQTIAAPDDDEEKGQQQQQQQPTYTERFLGMLSTLRDTLDEAALFIPGWIHWVSPSEDQTAPVAKNDSTYRRVLFAESTHHRHQKNIPVIRNRTTHSFERPRMTFHSTDEVDHPWWRKRVFDTLVKHMDNTPNVSTPFKTRTTRLLESLINPFTGSNARRSNGDGGDDEETRPNLNVAALTAPNRVLRFQGYWDQMMTDNLICDQLWASLPDAHALVKDISCHKPFPIDDAKQRLRSFMKDHLEPRLEAVISAAEADDFRDFVTSRILGRFELPRALSEVCDRRSEVESGLAKLQAMGALIAFRELHAEALELIAEIWFNVDAESMNDGSDEAATSSLPDFAG